MMGRYIKKGPFGDQTRKLPRKSGMTNKQKALVHQFRTYAMQGKSIRKMMLDAGYSRKTATDGYQMVLARPTIIRALRSFTSKLERQKEMALSRMSQTVHRATYAEAAKAVDILIKAQRLLEDKSTSNQAITVVIRDTDND